MSGLIATRAQLREYLERARGKRHRLNAGKILLIHEELDSVSGYSSELEQLIASHLGARREKERVQERQEEFNDFPDMDFEPLSGGEPDVTLTHLEESAVGAPPAPVGEAALFPSSQEQPSPSSQAPLSPFKEEQLSPSKEEQLSPSKEEQLSKEDYASFITHLKESIREEIIQEGRRETKWADYTRGNGRRVAAKNFFHLLIAASKHEVEVRQLQPMDDITVTLCDS